MLLSVVPKGNRLACRNSKCRTGRVIVAGRERAAGVSRGGWSYLGLRVGAGLSRVEGANWRVAA
jgi:hypothetical protein